MHWPECRYLREIGAKEGDFGDINLIIGKPRGIIRRRRRRRIYKRLHMVCYGSCLGLGVAAMGSHRQDLYEELRSNLYKNDVVTDKAARIATEMVILRSNSTHVIKDKFNAHFS
ncbi:26S proteasome non-ATPase regulatory subunit 1 [Acromyrmex echinatior]|uniref:26S proteasome non-ATPase regulatory subunit 1 n=1 Tax=Acromyrmex echinatior TaxID=103372 RepID=F4X7A9_ACREC|nr:26S proteasome non-ATPase regulatory subunit 1 [Acromyrmex echinatior]